MDALRLCADDADRGLAVAALVVWLVIQSRKGKHSRRKRP